ncbi:MAG: TonB-dependent receptor [Oxalicibacterium faecigallinarum]|uniref:TonB-dependent receptor family protein n=1 Tax=Oxalicibacterium faecigallinarum TaxID=573741 RepID=UPI002809A038|nr:TonB-dependent receptor [Oxalicibacterium faecigallinarum]MDQ7970795.1 TonB-dependent receptor [Oxalicibacterium faecigallinarum]
MQKDIVKRLIFFVRVSPALTVLGMMASTSVVHAQEQAASSAERLPEIVVSGSRSESNRFDVPAAIDVVPLNGFTAQSPLVNLSEVLSAVPGIQIRERQNYAQDLQVSIRGFGTRSTFGVRGVRILVDGIPATMPDGQGQSSNASLASASRIEVLRGPMAQLYGNAAGGVLQVFTKDTPVKPEASFSLGAGSDNQRVLGVAVGGGSDTLGGTLDVTQFSTDGYRDHSATRRTTVNAKVVARPSSDTKVTAIFNSIDQPLSQDPLGLTRADFQMNPRQVTPRAMTFDTRKTITQQQAGLVLEQRLSSSDVLNARVYGGERTVFQTLAFPGDALVQAGGVIDLDRGYGGLGLDWRHETQVNGLPLNWTLGMEVDALSERRRGFVNDNGVQGALRRDEKNKARSTDVFAQADWTFAPQWRAIAGVRLSRVRMVVDDDYVVRNPDPSLDNPDDSGKVVYTQTSPVVGLVWHARDNINLYANLGQGFETPTLAELAYRTNGTGPNLGLRASTSTQAEIGAKIRQGRHLLDVAVFHSRSKNEIVQEQSQFGRAIFQNVNGVERRGAEASWRSEWNNQLSTSLAYTWLDARFRQAFNSSNGVTDAGNRLPGAPQHSLYTELQYRWQNAVTAAVEMRADSKVYVDDINSDAASGYAVINLRAGYSFDAGAARMMLFGRIDNVFDRSYAGSVVVNESNQRFFEPAPGRRLYIGVRTQF